LTSICQDEIEFSGGKGALKIMVDTLSSGETGKQLNHHLQLHLQEKSQKRKVYAVAYKILALFMSFTRTDD
jgi:hypothetical protein